MCGVVGLVGDGGSTASLRAAMAALSHRGPDDEGEFVDPAARVWLGHRRLSILDLSSAGRQPMSDPSGRYQLVFNGEIYNYVELRAALRGYDFRTGTDSEVLLAAFTKWGAGCLDRLIGMFTFLVWDRTDNSLFVARDRFGVKPCYYSELPGGGLAVASEIKALHAAGAARRPDTTAWASYLTFGTHDTGSRTFWSGVQRLEAGHFLMWKNDAATITRWYDLAEAVGDDFDERTDVEVATEYTALLEESIALRFRADVPVGINLSGGLDSSALLAGVHAVQGEDSDVRAFTFITGDDRYDELPWVEQMLAQTAHPSTVACLSVDEVPALAESVQASQDEPFGGLPTLAYARLFEAAATAGVTVLLDGQGMDEQWAGYDYYRSLGSSPAPLIQGSSASPVRAECLAPEFRELARREDASPRLGDQLRNAQVRDIEVNKLPRALRFNDRVSMRVGRELREPFLDHRLVELAIRQPARRKIDEATGKVFLRGLVGTHLPARVVEAPKRPLQTPQREWLRGPLRAWATERAEDALASGWFDPAKMRAALSEYMSGVGDNSFFVWQWISVALAAQTPAPLTYEGASP